jgi:Flp pilus assembly protein TadD
MSQTTFRRWLAPVVWLLAGGLLLVGVGVGLWAAAEWYFCLPEGITAHYVGRDTCLDCHPRECQAWQQSEHARSMDWARPETVLGDFSGQEYLDVPLAELPRRLSAQELQQVVEAASDQLWAKVLAGGTTEFRQAILAAMPAERQTKVQKLLEHPVPLSTGLLARARLELNDLLRQMEAEGRLKIPFGLRHRMFRKGDQFFVRTEGPDGQMHDFPVQYVLGYWSLQQYLVEFPEGAVLPDGSRMPAGSIQALPIAWDVQGRRWFPLYPGEAIRPGDPLHWTGRLFNANAMCIECHTTGLRRGYDPPKHAYQSTFSEAQVSCEACHGPASLHVELARSKRLFWDRRYGVGLPRLTKADAAVQMDVCAPCHARRHPIWPDRPEQAAFTAQPRRFLDYYLPALFDHRTPYLHPRSLYHPDGQILEEDYEYGSFVQSKMFRRGVTCRDCHSVRTRQYYPKDNSLCTGCHLGQHPAERYDTPKHHFHPAGGPGSRCVDCHMPEHYYMVVDSRRDHRFGSPWPEGTLALGVPNACNGCHHDLSKGQTPQWAAEKLRSWYPHRRTEPPQFAQAIADGRQRRPSAVQTLLETGRDAQLPGIVRASALLLLGDYPWPSARPGVWAGLEDPDPLVRATALSLVRQATEQELKVRVVPLLADPVRAVRLEAVRALVRHGQKTLGGQDFEQAWKELLEGLHAMADQAEAHVELALLYDQLGQEDQAVAAYEQAVRLDPRSVIARNNLGILYARQARRSFDQLRLAEQMGQSEQAEKLRQMVAEKTAQAEAQYQAALAVQPELLEVRDNLARLYYSVGRLADAETQFRTMIAQAPDRAEGYFSLAQLLAEDESRLAEAASLLAKAAELAPEYARIRYNYGLALQKLGQKEQAERELLAAQELDPAEPDYPRALAILYAQQNRWTEAAAMARRVLALQPDDPAVHQMADQFQRRAQQAGR